MWANVVGPDDVPVPPPLLLAAVRRHLRVLSFHLRPQFEGDAPRNPFGSAHVGNEVMTKKHNRWHYSDIGEER